MNDFFRWENPVQTGVVFGLGNMFLLNSLLGLNIPIILPFLTYGIMLLLALGFACKVMKIEIFVAEVSLNLVYPKDIFTDHMVSLWEMLSNTMQQVLNLFLWEDTQKSGMFLVIAYFGSSILSIFGLEFILFVAFNFCFLYFKFQIEIEAFMQPYVKKAKAKVLEVMEKVPSFQKLVEEKLEKTTSIGSMYSKNVKKTGGLAPVQKTESVKSVELNSEEFEKGAPVSVFRERESMKDVEESE